MLAFESLFQFTDDESQIPVHPGLVALIHQKTTQGEQPMLRLERAEKGWKLSISPALEESFSQILDSELEDLRSPDADKRDGARENLEMLVSNGLGVRIKNRLEVFKRDAVPPNVATIIEDILKNIEIIEGNNRSELRANPAKENVPARSEAWVLSDKQKVEWKESLRRMDQDEGEESFFEGDLSKQTALVRRRAETFLAVDSINEIGSGMRVVKFRGGKEALVPVFASQGVLAPIRDQARRADVANRTTTISQTQEATWAMQDIIRAQRKQKDGSSQTFALMLRRQAIERSHQFGVLEEERRARGLDKQREQLRQLIHDQISFKRGFEMFQGAVQVLYGKRVSTLEELNEILPNVTSFEIAMVSMLQRVPSFLLISPKIYSKDETRQAFVQDAFGAALVEEALQMTAMLYQVDMHGINFAMEGEDDFRPPGSVIYARDQYEYLGITGKSEALEFVPFREDFREAFKALALLSVQDAAIYRRVWEAEGGKGPSTGQLHAGSYEVVGHGKLRKAFMQRLAVCASNDPKARELLSEMESRGVTAADFELPLSQLIDNRNLQSSFLGRLDAWIASKLSNKHILDLTTDVFLTQDLRSLFVLAGLLDHIPEILLREKPFVGFVMGYGKGVKIINQGGDVIDYVPFSPHIQAEAQEALSDEISDSAFTNSTAHTIFAQVQEGVEKKLIDEETTMSQLEKIALELLTTFRVHLNTRAKANFVISENGRIAQHALKMGAVEAQTILELFKRVGAVSQDFLVNVRQVRKEMGDGYDLRAIAEGFQHLAVYDGASKAVVIYHYSARPFELLTPVELQLYRDAIIHEIAHAIWMVLPEEKREEFLSISWLGGVKKRDLRKHFLTQYSQLQNSAEDFAEHFSVYVNHGPEFRRAASLYDPLRRKYELIRELFSGKDRNGNEVVVEYADEARVPLAQMQETISATIAKLNLEEALRLRHEKAIKRLSQLQEHLKEKIISIEQLEGEEDVSDEDAEDDDDGIDEAALERLDAYEEARRKEEIDPEDEVFGREQTAVIDALLAAGIRQRRVERIDSDDIRHILEAYRDEDTDRLGEILEDLGLKRIDDDDFTDDFMSELGDWLGEERTVLARETAAERVLKKKNAD